MSKAPRAANVLLKKKSGPTGSQALCAFLNLPCPVKKHSGPRTFHSKRSRGRPVFRLCDRSLKSRHPSAQRLLYHISGQNTSASPGQNSGQRGCKKKPASKMFQTTPHEHRAGKPSKAKPSAPCGSPSKRPFRHPPFRTGHALKKYTKDFSYPCKKNRAVFGKKDPGRPKVWYNRSRQS